ncbi:MAG: hypothetical protein MR966_03920 [Lachnospiraceae bacterium]|nr:hypothetical protein [Lachnospiraceae bacterium]
MAKITGVLFLTGIVFWLFAWETLAAAVLVARTFFLSDPAPDDDDTERFVDEYMQMVRKKFNALKRD